ncbi:pilus assembly protein PilM [Desulfonatronovibrio magnus]|uniref:pilus assembly protein PilM n=1 Tax=Desulfonatronovibrio magnus TaxID=698827 RepID=UPI0005EADB4A|nr:pilus assembly protein PilM [Desulfonatronovibrio magnus]
MTKDNEISSTDKLLSLIRSNKDDIYDNSSPEKPSIEHSSKVEDKADLEFPDLSDDLFEDRSANADSSEDPGKQEEVESSDIDDHDLSREESYGLPAGHKEESYEQKTEDPVSSKYQAKSSYLGFLKKMKFWPGKGQETVAVDFSRKSVKMIRMGQHHGSKAVLDARVVNLDREVDVDDPAFIAAFKKALDDFVKGRNVQLWSRVSSSKAEVWTIKVPVVKKGLASAIYWTAKKEKSFDEKENIFDYRIAGFVKDEDVQKYLVSVYTVPRQEKVDMENIFIRAGYKLQGLTVSTFAFQNIFKHRIVPVESEGFAVLYIDNESTRIDIFEADRLRLSRLIKTGLDSMLESIAYETMRRRDAGQPANDSPDGSLEEQGPPLEEMEKASEMLLSMLCRFDEDNDDDSDCFEYIAPVLRRLALQAERTLDHYVNVLGNTPVTQVFLAGSSSGIAGMKSFIAEQLAVPVEVLDPLNPAYSLGSSRVSLNRLDRMELALATGLSLSESLQTANLLFTAKDYEQQKTSNVVSRVTAAGCMVIVLAAVSYSWTQKLEADSLAQQADVLEAQLDGFDQILTTDYIQGIAEELEDSSLMLREAVRKNVPLGILSELSRVTPGSIRILNLVYNPDNKAREAISGFLTVEGIVRGDPQMFETYLSSYIRILGGSGLFSDSSIHNSYRDSLYGEGEVYRFVINVNLPTT